MRSEPSDDALTFFTVEEAAELRRQVRRAFAERGLEVTVLPERAVDSAGRTFGLWNVAAACHAAGPRRRWWGVVVRHVDVVLAALDGEPWDVLDDAALLDRVVARLYDATALPDGLDEGARPFAPGVVELLALDLPETVAVVPPDVVARLGGHERVRARGLANLRREPVEVRRVPVGGGAEVVALLGESVHTASRALLLPGLLEELGERPAPHGWLLAVPDRHRMALHVVRDRTVLPAVQALVSYAAGHYADAVGGVSPHLYWWTGREHRQLTATGEDGQPTVHVDDDLAAVLAAVTRD